jgi:hypothetical protein
LSKSVLALAIACFLASGACTTPAVRHAVQQDFQAPNSGPKVLAVYMPWFGDHVHMDVGYTSNDPAVLRRQIKQARQSEISAFVVDWYGPTLPFSDHNFALLQEAADESHFQVALLYNEAEDDDGQATDEAIAAIDKAYKAYIGPEASHRAAYLTDNGHPMIFIFPKHGRVDWNRVAEHCQAWETPPFFIYKDNPPTQFAADFAGSYAWVQPGQKGWAPDGSNWGEQYLEDFYKDMRNKHPDKIAVGAAWPGFDDSAAKWGLNRHMQSRCGQTLEDTLHLDSRYFDPDHPLPFVLIETWNDYEEGTAIERLSFAKCDQTAQSGSSSH